MRIAIISDAWLPQVNGVVRTLMTTRDELIALGHQVEIMAPEGFSTLPCPSYPEIRLALRPYNKLAARLDQFAPEALHVVTEGPLGLAARHYCKRRGLRFTTSFHTKFPEYVAARWRIPISWSYRFIRWFHSPASRVMVATDTMRQELRAWHFENELALWSRGVNLELFCPRDKNFLDGPRPVFLYVGRVAVEKSIEDFLRLDLPGSKYVVGDGPQREELCHKYPGVHFVGMKKGEELARHYAAADVFVFPSRTDTFGLVLLEALACGVPVAAYPVTGPLDVVGDSGVGVLDEDLAEAARRALEISPEKCREHASHFSWQAQTQKFLENLVPAR